MKVFSSRRLHHFDDCRSRAPAPINAHLSLINRGQVADSDAGISFAFPLPHTVERDMDGRATRLELLSFSSIPMRAFHLTWMAFFVCFFAWFAVAPLMPVDPRRSRTDAGSDREHQHRGRLRHDPGAIADRTACATASARDSPTRGCSPSARFLSSAISFAQSYEAFLFWRLCIGAIGASFVITQFHTSTHVCAERRRHRQCDGRGLGQCRRRRDASDHAADLRGAARRWV